jgi:hypothetical protein
MLKWNSDRGCGLALIARKIEGVMLSIFRVSAQNGFGDLGKREQDAADCGDDPEQFAGATHPFDVLFDRPDLPLERAGTPLKALCLSRLGRKRPVHAHDVLLHFVELRFDSV